MSIFPNTFQINFIKKTNVLMSKISKISITFTLGIGKGKISRLLNIVLVYLLELIFIFLVS